MDAALKSLSYPSDGQVIHRNGIDGQGLDGMRNDNRPVDEARPVEVAPEPASTLQPTLTQVAATRTDTPLPTLELPTDLDPVVERSLENFQWPPHTPPGAQGSQLVLRRLDVATGEVQASATLPGAPNELAVVTG